MRQVGSNQVEVRFGNRRGSEANKLFHEFSRAAARGKANLDLKMWEGNHGGGRIIVAQSFSASKHHQSGIGLSRGPE